MAARRWTLISEHIYFDEHGERFLKVRKCRDGDGNKQYPQYHWDGNGWARESRTRPKIPYRLPQLIAAPTAGIVVLVRGRKRWRQPRQARLCGNDRMRGRRGQMGSGANTVFQGSACRDSARRRSAWPRTCAEGRQGNQRRCRVGADFRSLSRAARRLAMFRIGSWTIPPARSWRSWPKTRRYGSRAASPTQSIAARARHRS